MAKSKSQSWLLRYTQRQYVVAVILGVSLMGNVAALAAMLVFKKPSSDIALVNYTLQRVCVDDLHYNLDQIGAGFSDPKTAEKNKALFSATVCGGWNYKSKQMMTNHIEAMMNEIVATP
jgi:hypothetical protein